MTGDRFWAALTRNALLAAILGVVFLVALPRDGGLFWAYLDAFALAFCFTFLGYYVEVLLLMIPGIDTAGGRLVRLAGWFAGGLWCYVTGRLLWTLLGRDTTALPGLVWGGVFFVALELLAHAVLRARGLPSFYGARGAAGG